MPVCRSHSEGRACGGNARGSEGGPAVPIKPVKDLPGKELVLHQFRELEPAKCFFIEFIGDSLYLL